MTAAPVVELAVRDEATLARIAAALFAALRGNEYLALSGPLGAGKTAFVRALLRAGGHRGSVRSPTFTLLEPYALTTISALHMDLYRIADADELEMLGIREQFGAALVLIEWPERGTGWLPVPDLALRFDFAAPGRRLEIRAETTQGRALCERVAEPLQVAAAAGDDLDKG